MLSATHPLRSGGTQANTFADVQKPLTYDTVLEGVDYLSRMKTNSGERVIRAKTKKYTLLIPDEGNIKETAFQLMGKNGAEKKPGTPNNDANYFRYIEGENYNVIIWDALNLSVAQDMGETTTAYSAAADAAYTNQWFIIDEDMLKETEALQYVVLESEEAKSNVITTDSMGMRFLTYSWFGFGVAAGLHTW